MLPGIAKPKPPICTPVTFFHFILHLASLGANIPYENKLLHGNQEEDISGYEANLTRQQNLK